MSRTIVYLLTAIQLACLLTIVYGAYLAIDSKPVFAIVVASIVLAISLYVEARLPDESEP